MALTPDDTIEMLQLYARYNTTIDTGDGDGFARCFVTDGVFDSGMGVQTGHEAIAAFAHKTHEAMPGMRHNASNIVFDESAQGATGSAFLIGYLVDGGFKVIVTGRYQDELVRTPDGWRFAKRVFRADT